MALKKPQRSETKRPFKAKALRKNLDRSALSDLANKIQYLESPHHCAVGGARPARRKLGKPASKCPRKWSQREALEALKRSIKAGFVSEEANGDFPRYVWYREGEDIIYEARGEPQTPERFHGYPVEDYEVPRELEW